MDALLVASASKPTRPVLSSLFVSLNLILNYHV